MVVRFVCVIRVSVRPVCAVCPGSPRSLFTGTSTRPVQYCTGRFRERVADQPGAWESLLTLHMSPMKTSVDIDMAALLKATVEIDGSTTSLHEVLAAGTGDRTLMLFVRNGA